MMSVHLIVFASLIYMVSSECTDNSLSIYVSDDGNIRAKFASPELVSDDGSIQTVCGLKCACFEKIFLCCSATDCIHMDHDCVEDSQNLYPLPIPLSDVGKAFIVNPSSSVFLQEKPDFDLHQIDVIHDIGSDMDSSQETQDNEASELSLFHDGAIPSQLHQDSLVPVNPVDVPSNSDTDWMSDSFDLDHESGSVQQNLHHLKKRSIKLMDLLSPKRINRAKREVYTSTQYGHPTEYFTTELATPEEHTEAEATESFETDGYILVTDIAA